MQEAARRYLAPDALTAVVVGDAEQIAGPLGTLATVGVTRTTDDGLALA